MAKFKSGNGYYLDRARFSSVSADGLWGKLTDYVKGNALASDSVRYDKGAGKITVISSGGQVNPMVRLDGLMAGSAGKELVRVLQLNVALDKAAKGLRLTGENTEEFPSYNTVSYQTACGGSDVSDMGSLFFHDSALADYTGGFDEAEWLSCSHYLAIITFTLTRSVYDEGTGDVTTSHSPGMAFVCYDASAQKMVDADFPTLNRRRRH